ncbi:MAG: glutathione S-transferase C-terminal domain-containing protein, partial [Pseudomonadota bacterium]
EGRQSKVPVLVDGDKEIDDSGKIAAYLEETYPDAPSLELDADVVEEADKIIGGIAFGAFFPFYAVDVHAVAKDEDKDYFRTSREGFLGAPLEQIADGRDEKLIESRKAIQPLRDLLGDKQWLHGDHPGYADYIVLAFFAWIRGVATTPPLAAGDPLIDYIERGFALYDGIGDLPGEPIAA